MPAAAVIPAPTAYIKVVAVKTFVVEHRRRADNRTTRSAGPAVDGALTSSLRELRATGGSHGILPRTNENA